ncbi:M28 family peptidase [Marinicella sp. W31]|uniref:M28 family peptidase n=1 Tax=Marinicella sp. W31 TaxID=3023713 RepID=UPI003756E773
MKYSVLLILTLCLGCQQTARKDISSAADLYPQDFLQQVEKLRDMALTDDTAYQLIESLTTEVGPRLGGSPADAAAVTWAMDKFKSMDFDKISLEPVTFRRWVRGPETAEIIAPFPQPLKITALGRSMPTPKEGITGEIAHFATIEDLEAATDDQVQGKIVYISNKMLRKKDGSGYGPAVKARSMTAKVAAEKGGIGAIIRSIGTDSHRGPHTGATRYQEGESTLPVGALSNVDADLLDNVLKRNKPVTVRYTLGSDWGDEYTSYNVIGDIVGREKPDEYVIIGGHLDSWDLGTGAIDDASGCGITMATASLIKQHIGQPRRTIRVILWANEEYGLFGARAYHAAHQHEMNKHIIGAESDFGAGRIYALASRADVASMPVFEAMAELLKPLDIPYVGNKGYSGPDLIPMRRAGMAVAGLYQDGTSYFDYHHTPEDTLDKVIPADIAQNVAVWVVFTALAAEYAGDFGFGLSD